MEKSNSEKMIYIEEGVKLNMHGWLIYEEFRKDLKSGLTERIEE